MTQPIIAYERTVLVTEKDALDKVKDGIVNAFPDMPLLCRGVDAGSGRAIRVVPFYKQEQVLAEIPLSAIKGADAESFQKRLSAGDFAPK